MSEGKGKITLMSKFTENIRHFSQFMGKEARLIHESGRKYVSIYGSQKK